MLHYYRGNQLKGALAPHPFENEKELQKLCEVNLEALFGLELVKSEFSLKTEFAIKGKRLDTLAYDAGTNSFVIIEYKREVKDEGPTTQATNYMKKMLTKDGQSICAKAFHKEFPDKGKPYPEDFKWEPSRYILVAHTVSKEIVDDTEEERENTSDRYFPNIVQVTRYRADLLREIEENQERTSIPKVDLSLVQIDWLVYNMPEGTSAKKAAPPAQIEQPPTQPTRSSAPATQPTSSLPAHSKEETPSEEQQLTYYYRKAEVRANKGFADELERNASKFVEGHNDKGRRYWLAYIQNEDPNQKSFTLFIPSVRSSELIGFKLRISVSIKKTGDRVIRLIGKPHDFLREKLQLGELSSNIHFHVEERKEASSGISYTFGLSE